MNTFTKLTAAASLALFASAAVAQERMVLDADGDGMLTEEEFGAAVDLDTGIVFAAADSDGDGMLSEPEYNDAAFAAADEDNSNSLDTVESNRFREITRMF